MIATLVRLVLVAVFLCLLQVAPQSKSVAHWMTVGDEAVRQGRYDQALAAYDRVLSRIGFQVIILDHMARASLVTQHGADVRMFLYAWADLAGWVDTQREQLANLFEGDGTGAQAATLWVLLDQPPENIPALRNLAQQYITQRKWAQAEITLDRLATLEPEDAQVVYQLGLLVAPRDRDLAADYLAQAGLDSDWAARAETVIVALDVYARYTLTDAHTHFGIVLVGLGEWPFAERVLQMALEANAVNPTALAYLGFVRDQQGRDGLPDIEAALALAPNDPLIYYLLGQHWNLAGTYDAAYGAFVRAYDLAPDNPALAVEVGSALQNLSDFIGAEKWFQQAIELDPSDVRWQRMTVAFYADTGFQLAERGVTFIEQAGQLAPNDPDIRASLGWALFQVDDFQRAVEELETAVALDASQMRSRYYLAVVLERQGDRDRALDEYWFVVRELGPDAGFGLLAARALQRLGYDPF